VKRNRPINADAPEMPPSEPVAPPEEERPSPGPEAKPAAKEESPPSEPAAEDPPRPVPAPKPTPTPLPPKQPPPEAPPPLPRRRKSIPLTPLLLAGLVVVAIAFIVLAVVAGGGGPKGDSGSQASPAPAPVAVEGSAKGDESDGAEELGYPSFATNNTTRIGGADAAANAAGVALAVFPATAPDQRPPAVTLVGEDDWAGAIAAAVLMAEPVGAPLLFSGSDEAPQASAEALAALAPAGDKATGGASGFAIGDVATPVDGRVTRVAAGSAAVEGAAIAELRDRLFGSPPDHVVIAPASAPEIAAPAAAWAARSGDPVLYAETDALPTATAAALRRHPDVPVYVLGPSSAISSTVFREIAKIDDKVKRVSGEDPVANAIAFARYSDGGFGWNINDPGHGFVLTRADAPLEAAAAAPLSASGTWGPLLLTDSAAKVPAELRSYLLDVKPGYTTNPTRAFYNHVWVIGDQEAIDVNQQAEVNELAELARIEGGEQ
jgi:hypothetical protein